MGGFTGLAPVGFPNVALANFMKTYRNAEMVGDLLFPRVPVDSQSFPYVIFDPAGMRLDQTTLVAPGARPQTIRMSYSEDKYFCGRHALDAEIPWQVEQYGLRLGFSTKQKSIRTLMDKLLLDREVDIVSKVTNTSVVTNYEDLGAGGSVYQWDDYAAGHSHPIVDVDNAREVIRQMAVEANAFIISAPTYRALRNHPDIIDRYKYRVGGPITLAELSEVFGVPVTVAKAIVRDKSNVGSWVWGANALLAYVQAQPGVEDLSFGKTFTWTAAPAGKAPDGTAYVSTDGYAVMEWPDAHLSSMKDWASGSWFYDNKVVSAETGFLFQRTCTPAAFGAFPAPTGE